MYTKTVSTVKGNSVPSHSAANSQSRHYAEKMKPRCATCDELIFAGTYTRAMDRDWHSHHFSCWHCDAKLTGQKYVLTDLRPTCITCYESHFASKCQSCGKMIGLECRDVSYKDLHWHEDCFKCGACGASLLQQPFAATSSQLVCAGCYDQDVSCKCVGCGLSFLAGTKKIEYKNHQWHDTCFHCKVCGTKVRILSSALTEATLTVCFFKVGAKSFIIPNDKDIYCITCFEDKVATKGVKCHNVLTSGGVTFRGEPWHKVTSASNLFSCQPRNYISPYVSKFHSYKLRHV